MDIFHIDWHDARMWMRFGLALLITAFYTWFTLSSMVSMRQSFAKKWDVSAIDAKRLLSARSTPLTATLNSLAIAIMFIAVLPTLVSVLPYRGGIWLGAMAAIFGLPASYAFFGISLWLTPARVITYRMRMRKLKPTDLSANRTVADIEAALSAPVSSVLATRIAGTVFIALACTAYGCIAAFHIVDWLAEMLSLCPKCM